MIRRAAQSRLRSARRADALWLPSHHGARPLNPQRHNATVARRRGTSTPSGPRTRTGPRTSNGPSSHILSSTWSVRDEFMAICTRIAMIQPSGCEMSMGQA